VRIAALAAGGAYTQQFRRIIAESQMEGTVFSDPKAALKWLLEPLLGRTQAPAPRTASSPPAAHNKKTTA
jgi:hypothetical protein